LAPQKYNELYEKFGNLNKLLGWGHARVIENLLAKKPDCPRTLSDQFADARVIEQSLLRHGRKIRHQTADEAESDIAVASGLDSGAGSFHYGWSGGEKSLGCDSSEEHPRT